MSIPENLAVCAGAWAGPSILEAPGYVPRTECQSTAVVTPIGGGKFLRVDYAWEFEGTPQEGSMLIGGDGTAATAHWIDTWHMGDGVLDCKGRVTETGGVSVYGSYPAPSGPDWGWRIDLLPESGEGLRLVMYNIPPDEPEMLAVDALYRRTA